MVKLFNIDTYKDSQEYFQLSLEINEFLELEKFVEDSNGVITWDKLGEEGVVKIANKRVEGIYWKGDLNLIFTSLKNLRKIKKIEGELDCRNIKELEDLGELEELGLSLDLRGTSMKSLGKLKKVRGAIYCEGLKELEDVGDLEEVKGDLDVRGTSIKLQIEVIKKTLRGEFQVGELFLDKGIKEILTRTYKVNKLDFYELQKMFGEDISKIDDEELKKSIVGVLNYEYKEKRKEVERKGNKIIEENTGKDLSGEKKEELRDKIKELGLELRVMKLKIESFGINIDDL